MTTQWNGFGALDLTDVQESGLPQLEVGKHIVTCTEAKVENINGTRNHKLVLDLSNASGYTRVNLNIFHNSTQAMEIALRQLKSFLVNAGHPSPDKPGDVRTLAGLTVGVIIGEGKPYTNSEGRLVTPREVKRFFPVDQFDEIVVAAPAAQRASPQQQQQAQNKSMGLDDEIPF